MSDAVVKGKRSPRRLLVRLGLVAVYIFAVGLVFVLGKGHTLIVDNKDAADASYKADDGITVSIDRAEGLELYKGDRVLAKLKGQEHSVTVEKIDGEKKQYRIKLPLTEDLLILSVPKLMAGIEPAVEVFVNVQEAPKGDEVGNSNAFTSPGGDTGPAGEAPTQPPSP